MHFQVCSYLYILVDASEQDASSKHCQTPSTMCKVLHDQSAAYAPSHIKGFTVHWLLTSFGSAYCLLLQQWSHGADERGEESASRTHQVCLTQLSMSLATTSIASGALIVRWCIIGCGSPVHHSTRHMSLPPSNHPSAIGDVPKAERTCGVLYNKIQYLVHCQDLYRYLVLSCTFICRTTFPGAISFSS